MARARGHFESAHVVWMGCAGWKDWELKQVLLAQDWVLVTRNSEDFRGPSHAPGSKGQYAGVTLHAGIICINGPAGMDLNWHRRLFEEALDELDRDSDLTNQVLEITLEHNKSGIDLIRYRMPNSEMADFEALKGEFARTVLIRS